LINGVSNFNEAHVLPSRKQFEIIGQVSFITVILFCLTKPHGISYVHHQRVKPTTFKKGWYGVLFQNWSAVPPPLETDSPSVLRKVAEWNEKTVTMEISKTQARMVTGSNVVHMCNACTKSNK